jgi:hypothetical protein
MIRAILIAFALAPVATAFADDAPQPARPIVEIVLTPPVPPAVELLPRLPLLPNPEPAPESPRPPEVVPIVEVRF